MNALRRKPAAILAALAIAATGVAWSGCGDDDEGSAEDKAATLRDDLGETTEDGSAEDKAVESVPSDLSY